MTISPADMLLFAAVVREGGFTAAARTLGITKQTASERVAKLEERLGVRLLERTTRRLRPTETGGRYYERCSAIAAQIEDANREAQKQQAEPSGVLRLSAPVLYGRRFLAPVVASYLGRHPSARVDIVLADRRVNLVEEGFDLAIRVGPLSDSSLGSRKLDVGEIYFVASPGFLSAHGIPTPEGLRAMRCIGMSRVETWEVAGVKSKIEPVLAVNDHEVACDAAAAGVGIARIPSLACRDAVRDGRLRVLFGADPRALRPVYAVFPSRRNLPVKVRVFLDALSALIDPMLPVAPARRGGGARVPTPP